MTSPRATWAAYGQTADPDASAGSDRRPKERCSPAGLLWHERSVLRADRSFFTGLHTGQLPGARELRQYRPKDSCPCRPRPSPSRKSRKAAGYRDGNFRQVGYGLLSIPAAEPFKARSRSTSLATTANATPTRTSPPTSTTTIRPFLLPGNDGQGVGKTYAQELIQRRHDQAGSDKHAERAVLPVLCDHVASRSPRNRRPMELRASTNSGPNGKRPTRLRLRESIHGHGRTGRHIARVGDCREHVDHLFGG